MARELFQEVCIKAINKLTDSEFAYLNSKFDELQSKIAGHTKHELFHDYHREMFKDSYVFCGYVSDKFIELLGRIPTPREIIIVVDNGINHMGARCTMSGRYFSGRINIA